MQEKNSNKTSSSLLVVMVILIIFIGIAMAITTGKKENLSNYSDACDCAQVLSNGEYESETMKTKHGYYTCKDKYGGWSIANEKCYEYNHNGEKAGF